MKRKILDTDFGMRVKLLADRLGGMSNLARISGISLSMIKKYIAGEADPSRTSLLSLMAAGQISFEWLATGGETAAEEHIIARDKALAPLSEETQRVVDAVIEIMASDDEGTKLALSQNAFTFLKTIRQNKEIEELKNDMEVIKKRILGEEDKDFKTSESARESQQQEKKHRVGGE